VVTLEEPVVTTFARPEQLTLSCWNDNTAVTLFCINPAVIVDFLLPILPPGTKQETELSEIHELNSTILPLIDVVAVVEKRPSPLPKIVTLIDAVAA
jgi:hypothetical protein